MGLYKALAKDPTSNADAIFELEKLTKSI